MPKFYAECGPEGRLVCQARERLEACVYLIHNILTDERYEEFELAPFTIVSEAGFNADIIKWGQESMSDDQYIFSTSTIFGSQAARRATVAPAAPTRRNSPGESDFDTSVCLLGCEQPVITQRQWWLDERADRGR